MVFLFNRTFKNILSNYIFHETIICNYQDLPQINIKSQRVNEKIDIFQSYCHSSKDPKLFNKVEYLQNELKTLMEANKELLRTYL